MTTGHVTGDLDGLNPVLVMRLDRLGAQLGATLKVESGKRSRSEQAYLYANRNDRSIVPSGVAAPPGESQHELGTAADVYIDGAPIQDRVDAQALRRAGLVPVDGDAMHVQLYKDTSTARAALARAGLDPDKRVAVDWLLRWKKEHSGGFDPLEELGDAAGAGLGLLGKGVSKAGEEAAEALASVISDWARKDGLRVLLYVVLVGGGFVLATTGVARLAGARREVMGDA
jgi:hypothetical protein